MSALFIGLLFCYQMRIFQIQVEFDSEVLIRWFNNSTPTPWQLHGLMDKIRGLAKVIEVSISHTYREDNTVAEGLDKHGSMKCDMQYFFVQELPSELKIWGGGGL